MNLHPSSLRWVLVALALAIADPVYAQGAFVRLWPNGQAGTIDANAETVSVTNARGMATAGIQITGTFTGTLTVRCTVDGSTWVGIPVLDMSDGSAADTITAAGLYVGNIAGCTSVDVVGSSWSMGTAAISVNAVQVGGGAGGGSTSAVMQFTDDMGDPVPVTELAPLPVEFTGGVTIDEVTVGAQPADDPHFVQCSDGSVAAACVVTLVDDMGSAVPVAEAGEGAITADTTRVTIATDDGVHTTLSAIETATEGLLTWSGSAVAVTDGGVPVEVDGTVNAAQSGTWNITNVSGTVSLPTGAATAANQSTGNTSLGTIAGDTTDIETAIEGLDHAEDSAHSSGHTGIMALGVRQDSQVDFGADGDYVPFSVDENGQLRVTGSTGGTSSNFGSALPTAGTAAGFFDGTNMQAGRVVDADTSGGGAFYTPAVNLVFRQSGTPVEAGTTADPIIVEAQAANLDQIGGAAVGASNPLPVCVSDGSDCQDPTIDATHDTGAVADGPQNMAAAANGLDQLTPVTPGDAVRLLADRLGRALSVGPCDPTSRVGSVTTVTDGSSTSAIAAAGSGITLEIWDVIIANTSSTAVTVNIRDGTAGSVLATFPVPADISGVVHRFSVPLTSTANTAIAVDPSAAATSIIVTLRGCKAQ